MATNYEINYNDERFTEVEADKKAAIAEVNKTYDSMINQSDKYYQAQIDASKKWADTQTKLQNERTDFAIEQIEQQKDQAHKDYTKEQSGAYVDWQKQSNEYGANAEAMAAQGMANTGYSESSQVSMYNTYQNRVATARESYNRAVLNYDNAIKDARLQNNAALAEIAYNALQTQLELSLEGFQYKNTLVMAKTDAKRETDNNYYSRYQDVLKQINTENSLAEEVRQYNESLAEERRQFNASLSLEQAKFNYQKAQDAEAEAKIAAGNSKGSNYKNAKKTANKQADTSAHRSTIKDRQINRKLENDKKNPPIDTNSVMALGFGPISASTIRNMEKQGMVERYIEDGKVKFRKNVKLRRR